MKRKNLTLSIVTAAALAAFGAANAHDVNTDTSASVDPTLSAPSESSISSSTSVDSSADISSSESMSSLASDSSTSSSASVDSSTDEERLKGLDRADQVAGVHGQHGRDNAREQQDRN